MIYTKLEISKNVFLREYAYFFYFVLGIASICRNIYLCSRKQKNEDE